ncbi:MAG TPA: phosphoglycerate dehydrogenase [Anaerolineae bacterium]|nr:phosphoglycerate dehydrogenase [Anaerolineae bacterium]
MDKNGNSPSLKILITDDVSAEGLTLLEQAADIDFDLVKGLTPETLAQRIPGYDGLIVRSSVKVTKEVLEAADALKVIGRAGVGVDNIDIDTASLRGIVVMNTPGANTIATAEHTVALLLAVCRLAPQAYMSMKQGRWDRKSFTGVQLYRKKMGIIGMGRIGMRVAARCQAFGMDVLTYDPYLSDEAAQELKVKCVPLSDLLAEADFIALHAALTPNTERIINADAIAQMKNGVRIVNTARGALIDTEALIDGLQSGKIAGVALDVFVEEPLPTDSPLLEMDNVIVTPHLAASTVEAQADVGTQVVAQLIDALHGVDFRNALNMPFSDAALLRSMQPYLGLAENLGSIQAQLAEDTIERIEVEIKGEDISDHIKPITVAILKGLLEPHMEKAVNYINAPYLVERRGIKVSQTKGLPTPDYPNLISCRIEWKGGGSRTISATLFNHDEPRLVQFDGYRLDVRPEGTILVFHSYDRPGFIGRVGTVLGELGINIATWRTGRTAPGGMAVSFVSVDKDVPDYVLNLLQEFELINRIQKVKL